MPLPGTRLCPYEILAPIGAGGMGEVYRGRDARLNRDVAIKVRMMAVEVEARAPALRLSAPRMLFERSSPAAATSRSPNYDVLSNGSFVMTEAEPGSPRLTVVLNWFEILKRKLASQAVR